MEQKHQKHSRLARPGLGQWGRNEWAILGTGCAEIQALARALNIRLSERWRVGYVDAEHSASRTQMPGAEGGALPCSPVGGEQGNSLVMGGMEDNRSGQFSGQPGDTVLAPLGGGVEMPGAEHGAPPSPPVGGEQGNSQTLGGMEENRSGQFSGQPGDAVLAPLRGGVEMPGAEGGAPHSPPVGGEQGNSLASADMEGNRSGQFSGQPGDTVLAPLGGGVEMPGAEYGAPPSPPVGGEQGNSLVMRGMEENRSGQFSGQPGDTGLPPLGGLGGAAKPGAEHTSRPPVVGEQGNSLTSSGMEDNRSGQFSGQPGDTDLPPLGGLGGANKPKSHSYRTANPVTYKYLKEFALSLRKHQTPAENLLWEALRQEHLSGYNFRRQHIIDTYIADFVCLEKNLIIELDGGIHELPEIKTSDADRTQHLNYLGYRVLRFQNETVMYDMKSVVDRILDALHGAPPSPPIGGEQGNSLVMRGMEENRPGQFSGQPGDTVLPPVVAEQGNSLASAGMEENRPGQFSGQPGDTVLPPLGGAGEAAKPGTEHTPSPPVVAEQGNSLASADMEENRPGQFSRQPGDTILPPLGGQGGAPPTFFYQLTDKITHHQLDLAAAPNPWERRALLNDLDLVLVNGNHFEADRQILALDQRKFPSLERKLHRLTRVDLFLTKSGDANFIPLAQLPDFLKDHLNAWRDIPVLDLSAPDRIAGFLDEKLRVPSVKALVLAGGRSTRMGEDKAGLHYHGRPHWQYLRDMLQSEGLETFVSCRPEQAAQFGEAALVTDTFSGLGPMGAILSAFRFDPDTAWLVMACDLPLLDVGTIRFLRRYRDPAAAATAYRQIPDEGTDLVGPGFPEPLAAIWEPKSYARLLKFLAQGVSCPRKVLINSATHLLDVPEPRALFNANTPEEKAIVLGKYLKRE